MSLTDENVTKKENFVDINIGGEKTQIRINGRNDSILELDLSDLGIIDRLSNGYIKIQNSVNSIKNLSVDSSDEEISAKMKEADTAMKEALDYIFDANVSEVCCKTGTMFDLQNGEYKFERILNSLTKLYDSSINEEYNKLKKRVTEKVNSYIPQDHKPKKKKEKVQNNE